MKINKNRLKYKVGEKSISFSTRVFNLQHKGIVGELLFGIYRLFLRLLDVSLFPVENAAEYERKTGNVELTLVEQNRKGVSANIILAGSTEQTFLETKPLPDIRLQKYKNVCIRGRSDVIVDIHNDCVISESAYNKDSNEEIIDGLLYRTSQNICLLRDNCCHRKVKISSGIMMSGKFCDNYYHVVYENLIRLLYVSKVDIPTDVPVVIDEKTYETPSFKRIVDILNQNIGRELVLIDSKRLYQFDVLYCFDHVNKLLSQAKNPFSKDLTFLYNQDALLNLRNSLVGYKSSKQFAKRIFISRANTQRRNFNEEEVFKVLEKFGFERYYPERLCFEEQMALFNSAEYIVAGSGAALTNLLFINNNCTVICFGISTEDHVRDVPVFNTIAAINGANFIFFPRKQSNNANIHANYEIDCDKLNAFMHDLLKS